MKLINIHPLNVGEADIVDLRMNVISTLRDAFPEDNNELRYLVENEWCTYFGIIDEIQGNHIIKISYTPPDHLDKEHLPLNIERVQNWETEQVDVQASGTLIITFNNDPEEMHKFISALFSSADIKFTDENIELIEALIDWVADDPTPPSDLEPPEEGFVYMPPAEP